VAAVLAEELRAGRVVHEDGGYRLVASAFAPGVLAALARLSPSDLDHSRSIRRVRLDARPTGDLARAIA
jgi:hypothetical protein